MKCPINDNELRETFRTRGWEGEDELMLEVTRDMALKLLLKHRSLLSKYDIEMLIDLVNGNEVIFMLDSKVEKFIKILRNI